jgi:hypothetical protein
MEQMGGGRKGAEGFQEFFLVPEDPPEKLGFPDRRVFRDRNPQAPEAAEPFLDQLIVGGIPRGEPGFYFPDQAFLFFRQDQFRRPVP